MVIRDGDGIVIPATVQQTKFYGDVALVEAAAINLGIQIAKM